MHPVVPIVGVVIAAGTGWYLLRARARPLPAPSGPLPSQAGPYSMSVKPSTTTIAAKAPPVSVIKPLPFFEFRKTAGWEPGPGTGMHRDEEAYGPIGRSEECQPGYVVQPIGGGQYVCAKPCPAGSERIRDVERNKWICFLRGT